MPASSGQAVEDTCGHPRDGFPTLGLRGVEVTDAADDVHAVRDQRRLPFRRPPVATVSEAVIEVTKVVNARGPRQQRSTQAGMKFRTGHREHEFPVGPQHASHLLQHRIDFIDVLEHRVGEDPVEAVIRLRNADTSDDMNGGIDPKLSRLRSLGGVGIDSDQVALPGSLQDDPREQPVTTAEVKAAALG